MTRPTGRVLTLLELLESGGTRTLAELADRLGVDPRTVRRYIGHLHDLDIPVEAVRGRYGGYRLAPGHRLPPLMLGDDEALAVLLGLVAARRTGLTAATATASETAAAKIRRVLPRRLAHRLDAVLDSLTFTGPPGPGLSAAPDAGVLLTVADAVRHRRPLSIRYTDRRGRHSERTLHADGLVVHSGRWYVTGTAPGIGEERTFRLDGITGARTLPGTFEAPAAGPEPAERVLTGFATAAYRHEVVLHIHGTVARIRTRLPASVATVEEVPDGAREPASREAAAADSGGEYEAGGGAGGEGADLVPERWYRVTLRVERLDWLPPVLASLDLPFAVERPGELRDLVAAFADRLAESARRTLPGPP
ncbi:helix-turn-helix transcriptional regulator [Streptomyces sp. NPDC057197]|uniref:helix-turn-helix transcriptional regulator n=1 Tax=Streptomyces sp. NPDC057197 TaxID=3346045 RepID=UPI0036306534